MATVPTVPELKPDACLLEYIREASRSAIRPRMILVFVVLVNVFIFSAFWNSLQSSWIHARLRAHRNAYLCSKVPRSTNPCPEEAQRYVEAEIVYRTLGTDDPLVLKSILDALEEARTHDVRLVRVPFFGIVFDVNDLGLLSAIGLSVVLLLHEFSLYRELKNIRLAFHLAYQLDEESYRASKSARRIHKNRFTRLAYDLLSMSQVAIIPPARGRKETRFWRHYTKSVLVFPFLTQIAILVNDWQTDEIGNMYSSANVKLALGVTLASLIPIGGIAFSSYRLWRRIESLWICKAVELGILERPDPRLGERPDDTYEKLPPEGKTIRDRARRPNDRPLSD